MTTPSQSSSQSRRESLLAKARRHMAGGLMHHTYPIPTDVNTVFARGAGSRLWDVDGREYIDYLMGSGPMILGHAHPEVVAAVQRRAAEGTQFFQLSEPTIELAETIAGAVPCAERVKFAGTGTEATLLALRLTRAVTGRDKILKFEGGYHGSHDYAVWAIRHRETLDYPRVTRPDSRGVPEALGELVLVAPYNDLETTASIIQRHKDELAAVIVEPFQRSIAPRPGFLHGLRQATKEAGVPLVFDEVVTGFRLAWGGAQERYGVVPDIAALGKAIGGGYPVGAVVGREEMMAPLTVEALRENRHVFYSGTFSGNPLTATAGLATLGVLRRPGAYERLEAAGKRLAHGLRDLCRMLEFPAFVAQEGSVVDVLFTDVEVKDYRDTLTADAERGTQFRLGLIRRGVWSPPGTKFYVSLAHSDEDIDRTLEAAEGALRELQR